MVSCWEADPLDRPIARDLIDVLKGLISDDGNPGREPHRFLMDGQYTMVTIHIKKCHCFGLLNTTNLKQIL